MKLKTRLTVSFCIILFVPILLAVVVVMGFQKYQFKTIETTYGLEAGNYRDLMNPLQLLNRYTKGNYEILMQKVSENPDHFLDPDFLNRMKTLYTQGKRPIYRKKTYPVMAQMSRTLCPALMLTAMREC